MTKSKVTTKQVSEISEPKRVRVSVETTNLLRDAGEQMEKAISHIESANVKKSFNLTFKAYMKKVVKVGSSSLIAQKLKEVRTALQEGKEISIT